MTPCVIVILLTFCGRANSVVSDDKDYQGIRCGKRTFIRDDSGSGLKCAPCPEGMYMDEEDHAYYSCNRCTNYSAEANVETTLQCTAEQNTIIVKCKDGFYIDHRANEYGCRPCPLCTRARQHQRECCPTTRSTLTPISYPATQTPGPNSNETEHETDGETQSDNVTRQQSQPSASGGSQLSDGQIVAICLTCLFLIIVTTYLLYIKFWKSRNEKRKRNRQSDKEFSKNGNQNTNNIPLTHISSSDNV